MRHTEDRMARKSPPLARPVSAEDVDPRHHLDRPPQIPERQSLAGMVGMRGAVSPKAGLFRRAAEEIRDILKAEGVAGLPLGIDLVEPPFLFALQELGVEVRDGQQVMLEARMLKSQ